MRTVIDQELIDKFVEGFITREEFEMTLIGISNKKREELLCQRAVGKWGRGIQVDWAIEEMAELTQALCKSKRYVRPEGWLNNIYEEMADVQIMLDTLKIVFGDGHMIGLYKAQKLERLERRLESEMGMNE